MILGIGNDLVDIRRIERMFKLYGIRFINRIFTREEQIKCETRKETRIASYARRFAAKEACAKALGTGFKGIKWKDLIITNLPSGKPSIILQGNARFHVRHLLPVGYRAVLNLSITDDYPMALAFVILEAQVMI